MSSFPAAISTITLFSEDLAASRRFYQDVFGLSAIFEDDVSAVFRIGDTQINVLSAGEAPELIEPAPVGVAGSGSRLMFTITVDDVDATAADLQARGVELLNGPVDRPWGVRTAAFADPAGHVWEIAQELGAGQ